MSGNSRLFWWQAAPLILLFEYMDEFGIYLKSKSNPFKWGTCWRKLLGEIKKYQPVLPAENDVLTSVSGYGAGKMNELQTKTQHQPPFLFIWVLSCGFYHRKDIPHRIKAVDLLLFLVWHWWLKFIVSNGNGNKNLLRNTNAHISIPEFMSVHIHHNLFTPFLHSRKMHGSVSLHIVLPKPPHCDLALLSLCLFYWKHVWSLNKQTNTEFLFCAKHGG